MTQEKQTRILLTGAGGAAMPAIIQSLRKNGNYHVCVADAAQYAYAFTLADSAYTIPFANDERFDSVFAQLLERERPDFVVPLVDEEILKVNALVERCAPSVRVVGPRPDFCRLALDKWAMAARMAELGLETALSCLASDVPSDFPFPAVVKPRSGRGSRGVQVVADRAALASYLSQAQQAADGYVLQQHHSGREFTTSVVVGLEGALLGVVPKEAVDKRGITRVGVTRRVEAIDDLCRRMHVALQPGGPFNVQLMLDPSGKPHVFEVNPRYSTTVALTIASGVDEVDMVVRDALGLPLGPFSFREDLMMLRHTEQLCLPEQDWEKTYEAFEDL